MLDPWEAECADAVLAVARSFMGGDGTFGGVAEGVEASALGRVQRKFGLDDGEVGVLALLAAAESDAEIRRKLEPAGATVEVLSSLASGGGSPGPEVFHPDSTLRQAQLVSLGPSPWLATSPVRIDLDVLRYLMGRPSLAPALDGLQILASREVVPAAANAEVVALLQDATCHAVVGVSCAAAWPIVVASAAEMGYGCVLIDPRSLPASGRQVNELAMVCNREAVLHDLVLAVDVTNLSPVEPIWSVTNFLHRIRVPLVMIGDPPAPLLRDVSTVTVGPTSGTSPDMVSAPIQAMSRTVQMTDLVLPAESQRQLRKLADRVRHATKVYDEWGFGVTTRGRGISALFAGPSGTGKTMAAEALATELGLDLYRVDLAATVSKYIGETEKNLARVFAAAEVSSAILLFDEADALFGKRTEIRDSHDRYANIEVSYLLQRIEAFDGVVILTSNIKSALDHAFARRLTVVIDFPLPEPEQRAEIWQRILPPDAPVDALDPVKLAQLSISGGSIHNIAVAAAFAAAEDSSPIAYEHMAAAARYEYTKLGRALTDSETRGWIT